MALKISRKSLLLLLIVHLVTAFCLPAAEKSTSESGRQVALWVLREGGRVLLEGGAEYISDPFELPTGDLRIVGVDMHGTVTDPKELGPLSKLTEVRELFLPA